MKLLAGCYHMNMCVYTAQREYKRCSVFGIRAEKTIMYLYTNFPRQRRIKKKEEIKPRRIETQCSQSVPNCCE